jgi:hypothetical protein
MFEPNTKMNINVITGIKDRRVVVIDNFYKNPDEIRDLALSLESDDSYGLTGALPGSRGILDTLEVKQNLWPVFGVLCKNYFGKYDERNFNVNWNDQIFMFNVLNDATLREKPLGIIPHQDCWESMPESTFQFGAVVYLNTPDECAGGTNLYSFGGEMSLPDQFQPQWVIDRPNVEFEYVKEKLDDSYIKEYTAEMKYNRMFLYQAEVLHGQEVDLGMFTEYDRINQIFFM